MFRQVICALDTGDVDEAISITKRLSKHVGTFKIGHGLTLQRGLGIVEDLKEAGAERIFLDLKFHDIPNSVALAVREACRYGVWMMTLHISGGPAMLEAAAMEANQCREDARPLLIGVSVLTSLDEHTLQTDLGVNRSLEEHMVSLSRLAMDCELDGVVCSPNEVTAIRPAIRHGVIVTPGIRQPGGQTHDQIRTGAPSSTIKNRADYHVIGRALTSAPDPAAALEHFGFNKPVAHF